FQRGRARGVAAGVGDLGSGRGPVCRQGPGRVPRGAPLPKLTGMSTRVESLRSSLEEPLLVTNGANVRYLTGFESSNAALLVGEDEPTLSADFRYANAGRAVEGVRFVETKRSLLADLAGRLSGRIGFEADALPYSRYETLAAGGLDLVP